MTSALYLPEFPQACNRASKAMTSKNPTFFMKAFFNNSTTMNTLCRLQSGHNVLVIHWHNFLVCFLPVHFCHHKQTGHRPDGFLLTQHFAHWYRLTRVLFFFAHLYRMKCGENAFPAS